VQRILNNWFVKWVLAPVAVLWALGWGYFQINYPTCTFRYKLTAEVMTPAGLKSGSSVIEVSYSSKSPIPNPGRWRDDKLNGEAVYVDLGQGKNLFVLLTSNESNRIKTDRDGYGGGRDNTYLGSLRAITLPLAAYKLESRPGSEQLMQQQISNISANDQREIPPENFPTLITFKDIKDINSVSIVEPGQINLQFGAGFSLSTISVEVTNKPITHQIDNVLSWLEHERPKDGSLNWNLDDPLFNKLQFISFKQPM
jgi:hypothetical protein